MAKFNDLNLLHKTFLHKHLLILAIFQQLAYLHNGCISKAVQQNDFKMGWRMSKDRLMQMITLVLLLLIISLLAACDSDGESNGI